MAVEYYDSEWNKLEQMLEKWIVEAGLTFEQRQSLIPIRDFIYEQTGEEAKAMTADG
jgi:hypothetical protein